MAAAARSPDAASGLAPQKTGAAVAKALSPVSTVSEIVAAIAAARRDASPLKPSRSPEPSRGAGARGTNSRSGISASPGVGAHGIGNGTSSGSRVQLRSPSPLNRGGSPSPSDRARAKVPNLSGGSVLASSPSTTASTTVTASSQPLHWRNAAKQRASQEREATSNEAVAPNVLRPPLTVSGETTLEDELQVCAA